MILGYHQDGHSREVQVWAEDGKLFLGVYRKVPGEAETLLTINDVVFADELLDDIERAVAELEPELEAGER